MEKKFAYQVVQKNFYSGWDNHGFFSNEEAAKETANKLRFQNENEYNQIMGPAQAKMVEANETLSASIEKCPDKDKKIEPEDPWDYGCEKCRTLHTLYSDPSAFVNRSDRFKVSELLNKKIEINRFELNDKCII